MTSNAKVYVGRYVGDLGAYRKALTLVKGGNQATIEVGHINRGQSFDVEFLVNRYNKADAVVDLAAPGVHLRRMSAPVLERELRGFVTLA